MDMSEFDFGADSYNLDEGDIRLSGADEVKHRALFFATALGISCSNLLKLYIEGCREKANREGNASGATVEHSGPEFGAAVKELLCVSVWLTLLEQDSKVPDWMRNFALEAMADADKLYADPPARSVMESYDITGGAESLFDAASLMLCTKLGLGSSSQDALIYLGQLLRDAKLDRSLLLATALRAPKDELDAKIAAM
jgi:hypothetical protein